MNSFELILPFLRPIEHLILDDGISEVMVNAGGRVFFERDGRDPGGESVRSRSGSSTGGGPEYRPGAGGRDRRANAAC